MKGYEHGLDLPIVNVRMDHRRPRVSVAKYLLSQWDVAPLSIETRCKRMPQRVR